MSLQVWLPLDGDLRNNGLSDYSISMFRGAETYHNNGKIGKAFHANGKNTIKILDIIQDFYNYSAYSLCAWFYIEAQNTSHSGSAIISAGDWNHQVLNLAVSDWSTDHYTRLRVSGSNWNHICTYDFLLNTWYHVVVSSDGNKTYAYIDGQLVDNTNAGFLPTSISGNDICIGGATYYSGMQFFGRINDVRIYDHCLSQKEIKEISKALILHYTLDDFALKNNNIIPNYLTMGLGSANPSTGTWRLAGTSNMSRSRVQITDSPYETCYGFQNSGIQTANDGSCYGIDNFPLEANTVYTISMFARITEGTEGYAGYNIYSATYNGGSWTHVDKNYRVTPLDSNGRWTRCWLTFTTNAATTRNIYIGITTGTTSVTTQMCCIRIEKGIPNFNTIYDSSGYCHNVVPSVKIIENINTPRYTGCIQMDGVNDHIIIPYNTICPDNIFTMNLWFYKSELGSKSYETLVGGPSGFEMDTRAGASTSLSLYMASTRGGNVFSPFEFNKWYMVTMVRDGTNEMYYVNGELKKTIEAKAMPTGTYYIGSWASTNKQNFKGLISDFRLYNSVLSASDIRELYKVKASVDRNSNFWAYEFQETGI